MIGNAMYDIRRDEYYVMGTNPEDFFTSLWYEGEPLWTTVAKQVESNLLVYLMSR